MIRFKIVFQFIIVFITFVTVRANDLLHVADSMYVSQNYNAALKHYLQVQYEDRFLKQDYTLNFKIGICFLKNKDYENAQNVFRQLAQQDNILPEYIDYFLFYCAYRQKNTRYINLLSTQFFKRYPDHFLSDSVLYHLADDEFSRRNYNLAFRHYSQLASLKDFKNQRPFFMKRMALSKLYLHERENALERMYQVMKNYPSSKDVLDIAKMFYSHEPPEDKYVFAIAEVYLKHGEFSLLTQKLEEYIKHTEDELQKEKARLYLLRGYYERGNYQAALYGFNNMLKGLKNDVLESRLRLMIARCHLRLDDYEQAADVYIAYGKRFPRRRLAAETTWKAAWIYEELGDVANALQLYRDILTHWPYSDFRYEAKFRLGLSHFRLGNFDQARRIFTEISQSRWSKFHKYRSRYWLAKSYAENGSDDVANSIYIDLANETFESYYTLKSYMLYKEHMDTVINVKERLARSENPLKEYTASMGGLMEKFEKLFIIREILGEDMTFAELAEKKYYPRSLKEWVALAEVYKRLGAYNRAFKVYDYIDNHYYANLTSLDKPFLLKESYPLYYDNLISSFSDKWSIDKNLTLALIRQESGYNRMARSYADAYGLMQIIPRTAAQIATELQLSYSYPDNLYDAQTNINMGTYYLYKLLEQYDHRIEFALAAYNAGSHRVKRWRKIIPADDIDFFIENIEFSQTRNYVRLVMRNYWIYSILQEVN